MNVRRIDLDPNDDRVVHEPTIRFSPQGGCPLPSCGCSNHPYLFVSDGTTALSVELEPDEAAALCRGGRVEL